MLPLILLQMRVVVMQLWRRFDGLAFCGLRFSGKNILPNFSNKLVVRHDSNFSQT